MEWYLGATFVNFDYLDLSLTTIKLLDLLAFIIQSAIFEFLQSNDGNLGIHYDYEYHYAYYCENFLVF